MNTEAKLVRNGLLHCRLDQCSHRRRRKPSVDEHDFFAAERKLGLTRNQALELFTPALNIPYSEVTPQQAADVLLRLLDTRVQTH